MLGILSKLTIIIIKKRKFKNKLKFFIKFPYNTRKNFLYDLRFIGYRYIGAVFIAAGGAGKYSGAGANFTGEMNLNIDENFKYY